jgi:hypothetical protein
VHLLVRKTLKRIIIFTFFHCAFRSGCHIIEFGTESTDAGKTIKCKTDIVYIPKVPLNLPFFSIFITRLYCGCFRKIF